MRCCLLQGVLLARWEQDKPSKKYSQQIFPIRNFGDIRGCGAAFVAVCGGCWLLVGAFKRWLYHSLRPIRRLLVL